MKYILLTVASLFLLWPAQSNAGISKTPSIQTTNASLQFDGVDDYVNLGDILSSLESMSFSAWVYRTGNNGVGYDYILSKEYTVSFAINNSNNKLAMNFGNGSAWGTAVESTDTIPMNQWVYVTGTRDSRDGSVQLYINGVLKGSGNNNSSGNYSGNVCLGHKAGAAFAQSAFEGNMDEVRIWTKTLCSGEISQYMFAELTQEFSQLYASYSFNQGTPAGNNTSATQLSDLTQFAHTGTLTNFGLNGTGSNWMNGCAWLSGSNSEYAMPNAAFTSSGGTSVCSGSTLTFTAAQSGLTYAWSTGETSQSISTGTAGKYSLTCY
jgi:hypothetical protein